MWGIAFFRKGVFGKLVKKVNNLRLSECATHSYIFYLQIGKMRRDLVTAYRRDLGRLALEAYSDAVLDGNFDRLRITLSQKGYREREVCLGLPIVFDGVTAESIPLVAQTQDGIYFAMVDLRDGLLRTRTFVRGVVYVSLEEDLTTAIRSYPSPPKEKPLKTFSAVMLALLGNPTAAISDSRERMRSVRNQIKVMKGIGVTYDFEAVTDLFFSEDSFLEDIEKCELE